MQVVVPEFVEESGKIEVYKKDPNGRNLSGARFTATKTDDSSKVFHIVLRTPTVMAATTEDVPYGTYTVVESLYSRPTTPPAAQHRGRITVMRRITAWLPSMPSMN